MNKDEAVHAFEKKEQAEAFAKGESPEEGGESGSFDAKAHEDNLNALAKALEAGNTRGIDKAKAALEDAFSRPEMSEQRDKAKAALDAYGAANKALVEAYKTQGMAQGKKEKAEAQKALDKATQDRDAAVESVRGLAKETPGTQKEPDKKPEDPEEPAADDLAGETPKEDAGPGDKAEPETPESPTEPAKIPEPTVTPKQRVQRKKIDEQLTRMVDDLPPKVAEKLKGQLGLRDPSPERQAAEAEVEAAQEEVDAEEEKIDRDRAEELRDKIYTLGFEDDPDSKRELKTLREELKGMEKDLKVAQERLTRATKESRRLKQKDDAEVKGTKDKFIASVTDAMEAEEDALKEALTGKKVTTEMMEDAAKDPLKNVNWEDPVSVAKALAKQSVTNEVLLNPAKVGGKGLSESPLEEADLVSRANESFEQYRKGKGKAATEMRKKAATRALEELASLPPDSHQAKELNRIIDGLHLAMEANDEEWDLTDKEGKLVREPLDPKHRLLAKQMIQQGDAKVLLSDNSNPRAAREAVRDAMGRLDDSQLHEMSKDTPWEPLGELLSSMNLDPEVAELLRGLIRDMGINNMVTNQGLVNAVAGKKMPASNPLEVYDQVREKFQGSDADAKQPKGQSIKDGIADLVKCLQKAKSEKEKAECGAKGDELKLRQVREMYAAMEREAKDAGVDLDPKNPHVAAVRHAAESGDLSVLDADLKPERTFEQERQDWIKNMKDPADRERVQQMSEEEFRAMTQGVLGGEAGGSPA